jgi:hypothetical protein
MSSGEQFQKRRIINWPQYNQAWVQRGSITFWFDRDIRAVWFHKKTEPTGRGLDKTFSDEALQACLMLRSHYGLTLRALEGFVHSLFALMGLPLTCPDYTLSSKGRGRHRAVAIPRRPPPGPVDIVVDSTGLKVFGDGAYGQERCYEAILARGGTPVLPPRKDALAWDDAHPRTRAVRACSGEAGRKDWKRCSAYQRRSLSETALFRYKQLIGPTLRARHFETQQVEVHAALAVLNRLHTLGMPVMA